MTVQISIQIDESTKQQFDKVCESIGISPSNAFSMFIKSVINYKGIPFKIVAPQDKGSKISREPVRPPFEYESMSDKMLIADDFDAPLDDFKEYME